VRDFKPLRGGNSKAYASNTPIPFTRHCGYFFRACTANLQNALRLPHKKTPLTINSSYST